MVTLREILALPSLAGAEVVAGHAGLDRPVRWVHVSELLDIARLLDGGEFLLTTGLKLVEITPEEQADFVRSLAGVGAAGLGLELVRWLREPPPAVVQASDETGLPLVVWRHEVKYRVISEEVGRFLFERRYGPLRVADHVTTALMRAFVEEAGAAEMVRIAHGILGRPVCLVTEDGLVAAAPAEAEASLAELRALGTPPGEREAVAGGQRFLGVPVFVGGEAVGAVWLGSAAPGDEGARVLVQRIALALSCELLRRRQRQDVLRSASSDLAEDLLSGAPDALLRERLALEGVSVSRWFAVLAFEVARPCGAPPREGDPAACRRLLAEAVRAGRTGPGRGPDGAGGRPAEAAPVAVSLRGELVKAVLTGPEADRLVAAARRLAETAVQRAADAFPGLRVRAGVSRPRARLDELREALREAMAVIRFQAEAGTSRRLTFDELHLCRWLMTVPAAELRRLVRDELQPLLSLPEREREELLRTLDALLEENFNVSAAARRLHLRRQSLYPRLSRLEALLGPGLERAERRGALLLALRAREVLGDDAGPAVQAGAESAPTARPGRSAGARPAAGFAAAGAPLTAPRLAPHSAPPGAGPAPAAGAHP